jgi:hypothetical protein
LAELTSPVSKIEAPVKEVLAAEQSKVVRPAVETREPVLSGARTTGRDSESSPHFDGRAQPGDVLGIETGGETTEIGDTADTENSRRQNAEKKS